MRRQVVWSQSAQDDYLEAIGYIARDNPDAALRVAGRIEAAGNRLGEFAVGRRGRVPGTYEKSVAGLPYIIAYEVVTLPDGIELIAVLRVIHGARNWPKGNWPDN
ncbi:MAG: type II toxin-antitoxin system RelE/ParE family toxin [Geminicoccaceae bacterium]